MLRAQDPSELCSGCHTQEAKLGSNHPLDVESSGVDGPLRCTTCHDLVTGDEHALLRDLNDGAEPCLACHTEEKSALNGGHASVSGGCSGCHNVHGGHDGPLLSVSAPGDERGCAKCHDEQAAAPIKDHGHPRGVGDGERAVEACADCHGAHAPEASPDSCSSCHEDVVAGGHSGETCVSCHPAHGQTPLGEDPYNVGSRCMQCHEGTDAAFTSPVRTAHPDWTCATCHLTHGPDPASPRKHLVRPGLTTECADCHGPDSLSMLLHFHRTNGGAP
jgi:predicted CXXCH cytochrome family protein